MRVDDLAARAGRRPSTTRASISRIALPLFARNGFDETSVDEIAEAAHISRRTLFRYFASKNDIPWGDFDAELARMRAFLVALPPGTPLAEELGGALVDFNTFPAAEAPWHRQRMRLVFGVPALQAHSALMYAGWRQVVAEHAARRLGVADDDHLARSVAWMFLGVAIAAYEQWLDDETLELVDLLREGASVLAAGLRTLTPPS
ncbi:mycofactocin system transcriptional regulator [Rhodococcus sp. X156]|uniref:mycofactocin system transcriptional regulator n=1 Tax=Rhodococcus sp. X156 TaxID=2499145 RepID=UPI001F493316|nr:mycofactocin system transcriptional regulator [Rhodococcus sp. X156]